MTNDAQSETVEKKPAQKPRRLKALAGKLLLILFGILVGALIAEVTLRVAGFSYPEFYQPDESRGYALRPGMEGWYRKEGQAYVRINSDGLRDREHSKAKPAGTFRIAVLGDSYPEALQVAMEESFWAVMERKLSECGAFDGKKIEVINFGVSGYGTAQELITLRERVWDYSPDLVMLAITTNNDISDNLRSLKKTNQIPYFIYRDRNLALDDSFTRTSSFWWRQSKAARVGRWFEDHSRLVQAIERANHGFKIWLAAKRTKPAPSQVKKVSAATPASEDELGVDNVVYREPRDAEWNDAWRVTEELIALMRDEVQSHGARFLVVTLSNSIQDYPNPEGRESFLKRADAKDLFYPDKRIGTFCAKEGIAVFTLAPAMQAYADQNKAVLHGFADNIGQGHWNQLGHRVAGEMIAKELCGGAF
ncbi:MAG: SGNH/GDSL hydrolase family protein [bacterium]